MGISSNLRVCEHGHLAFLLLSLHLPALFPNKKQHATSDLCYNVTVIMN